MVLVLLTVDSDSDVSGVRSEAGDGGHAAGGAGVVSGSDGELVRPEHGAAVVSGSDGELVRPEHGPVDHQSQTARSVQCRRRRLCEQRRRVSLSDKHRQLRRRVATDTGTPQPPRHVLFENNLKTVTTIRFLLSLLRL